MKEQYLLMLRNLDLEEAEYNVDDNLDSDLCYIESVLSRFVRGIDLDTAMNETLDFCVDTSTDQLFASSKYIESDIDTYMSEVGANKLRDALIGGQCNYYKRQLYNNEEAFYTNALILLISGSAEEFIDKLEKSQLDDVEIILKELPILTVKEPMNTIINFTEDLVSNSGTYSPINSADELFSKFNEFVTSEIM